MFSRTQFLTFGVLVFCGGGFLIWSVLFQEGSLRRGKLIDELMTHPSSFEAGPELNALFARFVPEHAPLVERVPMLEANGFRCAIGPAITEGNRQLTCRRPFEATGYCEGLIYFSYETADGQIMETMVAPFKDETPLFGQCRSNRQLFLELPKFAEPIQSGLMLCVTMDGSPGCRAEGYQS